MRCSILPRKPKAESAQSSRGTTWILLRARFRFGRRKNTWHGSTSCGPNLESRGDRASARIKASTRCHRIHGCDGNLHFHANAVMSVAGPHGALSFSPFCRLGFSFSSSSDDGSELIVVCSSSRSNMCSSFGCMPISSMAKGPRIENSTVGRNAWLSLLLPPSLPLKLCMPPSQVHTATACHPGAC